MRAEYCGSDGLKLEDDSSELKKKKKGSEAKTMSWMVTHLDAVFTPERKSADYLLKLKKFDCDVYSSVTPQVLLLQGRSSDDHIFWVSISLMDNCTSLMSLILPNWFVNAE